MNKDDYKKAAAKMVNKYQIATDEEKPKIKKVIDFCAKKVKE